MSDIYHESKRTFRKMITLELHNVETSLVLNSKRNVWSITVHAVKRPDEHVFSTLGAADIVEIPLTLGKRILVKNAVYNIVGEYEDGDLMIVIVEISGVDFDLVELVPNI